METTPLEKDTTFEFCSQFLVKLPDAKFGTIMKAFLMLLPQGGTDVGRGPFKLLWKSILTDINTIRHTFGSVCLFPF
jgi:hypothetical protein